MMEHAKSIEPDANASTESVVKATPRESTASLFSLHEDSAEAGDLSFSNCSDKPALTLVLPEESVASTSMDVEDADDDATLSLVEDAEADVSVDLVEPATDDTTLEIDQDEAVEAASSKPSATVDPVVPVIDSAPVIAPVPVTASSSIFSTADLRPISRPSRFILPDEAPAVPAAAARIELPKPVTPVIAAAVSAPQRPAPVSTPSVAAAPEQASEKKAPPPVRVGSGQLQPTRVNWKPGEPFGDSAAALTRFRWELMLTTACGTAACGLAGIWLLRTILS